MKQLLKEIAEVSAGQGALQGDSNYCEDGIPFVKAGNLLELTEGKSIHGIQKVSEAVAKKYRLRLYKKGTILFAKSGMSCLKGYVHVRSRVLLNVEWSGILSVSSKPQNHLYAIFN